MRSDVRALFRILMWAGVVTVVVMAVLAVAAFGPLNRAVAAGVGLGVLVVGSILVGRYTMRGLVHPGGTTGRDAEPGAAADRGRM